jgi:uncharacterized membrane protein
VIASLLLILHALSAVVWVGGMFFAHQVLRPAAGALEPGPRLTLWSRVLGRFFAWVFAAIFLLLVTGYAMVFGVYAGFGGVGVYVHLMQGIGIVMMLLFLYLFFMPWRRFSDAVERRHFPAAAKQLDQIRRIVAANLVLGLLTIIVGASGRFW